MIAEHLVHVPGRLASLDSSSMRQITQKSILSDAISVAVATKENASFSPKTPSTSVFKQFYIGFSPYLGLYHGIFSKSSALLVITFVSCCPVGVEYRRTHACLFVVYVAKESKQSAGLAKANYLAVCVHARRSNEKT